MENGSSPEKYSEKNCDTGRRFIIDSGGQIEEEALTSDERRQIEALRKEQMIRDEREKRLHWESRSLIEKRKGMADTIRNNLEADEEYMETIGIEENGNLNNQARLDDGIAPLIVNEMDLENVDELFRTLKDITKENPDLDISIKKDPEGRWIEYTFRNKRDKI